MSTPPLSEAELQRYSRQILLREVGGHGQARILATRFFLDGDSPLADLAERYLRGAGAEVERRRSDAPRGFTVVATHSDAETTPALLWAISSGERCTVGIGEAALAAEIGQWTDARLGGGAAFVTAAGALSLLAILQVLGRLPASKSGPDTARSWRLDASSGLSPVWDEPGYGATGSTP